LRSHVSIFILGDHRTVIGFHRRALLARERAL
jgi:hypothetical protein